MQGDINTNQDTQRDTKEKRRKEITAGSSVLPLGFTSGAEVCDTPEVIPCAGLEKSW